MKIRSSGVAASILVLGALSLGGCATKGFVRDQVAVVDTKVQATDGRVQTAEGRLGQHDAQIAELDKTSREALQRAEAAGKLAEGKFVYSMVLQDDAVKFRSGRASLTPEAEQRLAEFADRLKSENRSVYLEIQGHTDNSGSKEGNMKLGEMRAEAVRRALSKDGVPLHRMATISYGEDAPAAPNTNRNNRAANRRVVVVVLA